MNTEKGWYEGDEWRGGSGHEPERPPSPVRKTPSTRELFKTNWLELEMGMIRHRAGGWFNPDFEIAHDGDMRWPIFYIPPEWVRGRQSYRTFQRAVMVAMKRAAEYKKDSD